MANPIQKTDLISDEALRALEEMSRLLREDKENMDALMASFKQYAGSIQPAVAANNSNNDALTAALQKVSELEKAYSDLQRLMKENAATQKAVAAEKRKYAKLTADEAESVKRLSENVETYIRLTNSQTQSLKGLAEVYAKNIVEIDIQKKSYNELYQTYNALKDALNKMTVEERLNTEAGKKLTEQSLKIRDTLNELQKSTGNYTFQVGKYRAAFDGLGYSFQQILREAPSALNLNQFFLAISNNIPQFLDQVKAFNYEQKEIKANLAQMTEGTKEYAEQMGKVMTLGQKLAKTLLSWQTLVLTGLLVIRNWEKIVAFVQKLIKKVDDLYQRTKMFNSLLSEMQIEATKSYHDTEVELRIIGEQMRSLTQGTDEWRKCVQRVNELTNSNLDTTHATIKEVDAVTDAYLRQAEILAYNAQIIGAISGNDYKKMVINQAISGELSPEKAASLLGLKDEKLNEFNNQLKKYQTGKSQQFRYGGYKSYNGDLYNLYKSEYEKGGLSMSDAEEMLYSLAGILTEDEIKKLKEKYKPTGNGAKNNRGGSSPALRYVDLLRDEVLDKDAEIAEELYERRLAMFRTEEAKERFLLERKYEKEREDLKINLKNKKITESEYFDQLNELNDNYWRLTKEGEEGNVQDMGIIQRKYWQDRQDLAKKELERQYKEQIKQDKDYLESVELDAKKELVVVKRRIRTISDEKQKNSDLIHNIVVLREELKQMETQMYNTAEGEEAMKEKTESIRKEIEKLRQQLDFSKELSLYDNIGDILKRNFSVNPITKDGVLTNIFGEERMVEYMEALGDEYWDWIETTFEKWSEEASKSVTTWYSTTKDYINDLIDAYIELANAKADAAKEATDAAQEEYEKEKALLEAGYANRVETMWSEYQQKKAIQEQAEKDAAAAAAAQKQLNEIETAGSLITASANIWKAFGQWPPLAIAAIATMWGSFLAAKAKAAEVSKYGEGDVQLVGGGSHASGHDTLLGYSLQGREMRVENGEVVGIIPRRSVKRLGEQNVLNTMRALRDGTFEANAVKMMDINRNAGNIMFPAYGKVDLSKVERSLNNIDRRGETQTYIDAQGNIIEKKSNGTTKYIRRR